MSKGGSSPTYDEGAAFASDTSSGVDPQYFADPGASGAGDLNVNSGTDWTSIGGKLQGALKGASSDISKLFPDQKPLQGAPAPASQPGRGFGGQGIDKLVQILQSRQAALAQAQAQGAPPPGYRTLGLLGF